MKIRQYQIGGVYSAPSSTNTPYGRGGYGSGSGRTAAEKTPFKDATIKLLEQAGLPSDFNKTSGALLQIMQNFETGEGDYDPAAYVAALQLVNQMKLHKAQYDEAQTVMKSNDSGEDIAMHGSAMYAANKETGALEIIKPEEFDSKKYQILTNNDLMRVRAHDNGSAFNENMLLDVASSTSMSAISKKIIEQAKALANTSDTYYMDQNGNMKSVIEGASALIQEGPRGVYKFGYDRQIDPKDIKAFVDYAYNYLLNENERSYLRANCAARGHNPNSSSDVKDVLYQTVNFYTKTERTPDFDKTASEAAGYNFGGDSGSGSDIEMTLAEIYSTGKGVVSSFMIKGRDAKEGLVVRGINEGPIMQKDDETPIGTATIQHILDNTSALRKTILGESISFGGQLLSENDKKAIVYRNSDMYRVELPYKIVNGNIVPNLSVIDAAEEIRKSAYDSSGKLVMSEAQIKQLIHDKLGNSARWDSEHKQIVWNQNATKAFLVAKGYVSNDRTTDIDFDSPYLRALNKNEGREILDEYRTAIEKGALSASDKTKQPGAPGKHWWNLNETNDFYVGDVYFALDNGVKGSMMTNRPRNPKQIYHEADQRGQHVEDKRNRQFNFNR